ncbi:YidC/Oxa1 family membrane protein insertase [Chloroflexota bacterium]
MGGGAHSFGLAIILLTIGVRIIMIPLTLRQTRTTRAMQEMQAEVKELQKKYGRDRQRMSQEQMALYKKHGVNPIGCAVPMLIQFPIWIALYQSIIRILALTPEGFLNLSRHLYGTWENVFFLVPLDRTFLWLDMAIPDSYMVLPFLVGASMWVQQKMTMVDTGGQSQQQQRMMLWMMPIMFTFLSLQFPSGLALYWVINNAITIAIQYRAGGWGGLVSKKEPPAKAKALDFSKTPGPKTSIDDVGADVSADSAEGSNDIRKPARNRYQPGKDRSRGRKK